MTDLVQSVMGLVPGNERDAPTGTVHVVDQSPMNWLWINYHVVEELVRVNPAGHVEPAAMAGYTWVDNRTLDVEVRPGNVFADGESLTAASVKQSHDELGRWKAPHPPGTAFNHPPGHRCEVTGEHSVRFHFPEPDGLAVGKLRAMHVMGTRFWDELGFGYKRFGTGEGHW